MVIDLAVAALLGSLGAIVGCWLAIRTNPRDDRP